MKSYFLLLAALVITLTGCNAVRWTSEASEVAYQETRPVALLRKYRQFKAMAAALDAKQATILTYEAGVKRWYRTYGQDPTRWPRDVRESLDLKETELAAMKGSFNLLAADYNRAMADYTQYFCNIGNMPAGFPEDCQQALKRSYAAYMIE